jgi:putative spermidine/putrescine transport system ATP-binding protein
VSRPGAAQGPSAAPRGAPGAPVLGLRRLRKTFGATVAVDDLSLDVARGELVCLLGPSGCGKTTTLRMVAGFVTPTSGDVLIEGVSVGHLPPYRRDTGMVFQHYALFPHLTVAENVGFGLRSLGVPRSEREARVQEMLALVEMAPLAARLPRELSGGQQQRVALARALALRPAVLLLDEPLSNLDAQLRVRMREEIRSLIRRLTMTTLFVTHDQEEALVLADRIVVMNRGAVEQVASPDAVYEAPATRFVAEFIGLANLLDGTVVAPEGPDLVIETRRGLRLRARREPGPSGQAGQAVTVIVRPEHLRVTVSSAGQAPGTAASPAGPAGPGGNSVAERSGPAGEVNRVRARVLTTTYLGSLTRHRLHAAGEELLTERHAADAAPLAPGTDVWLTVDPARVRLLR